MRLKEHFPYMNACASRKILNSYAPQVCKNRVFKIHNVSPRTPKGGGGAKRTFPPRGVHIVLQIPPSKGPNREQIVSQGDRLK